jgi:hypothetical protein
MKKLMRRVLPATILLSFALRNSVLHAQDASAFGVSPASPLYSTIRNVSISEARKIERERVCQISVPLIGGSEVLESSLQDLKNSRSALSKWERDYQRLRPFQHQSTLALPGTLPDVDSLVNDKGFLKYFKARSQGISFEYIDLFISTFIIKKLLGTEEYSDVLVETNRLITSYNLTPNFHQVDQTEKSTYLAKDTMSNIILFYNYVAQNRIAQDDSVRFYWLVKYLGVRAQLRSAIELFNSTEIDDSMLKDAASLAVEAANGRIDEAARQQIAAAWITKNDEGRKAYIVIASKVTATLVADLDDADVTESDDAGGAPPRTPPPPDVSPSAGEPDDGAGGFRWLRDRALKVPIS